MKRFFTLLAAGFLLATASSHAIVGGPWDYNNFDQNNSGTYSATIFMSNGLGMARFTNDASAQFSVVNQSIIFYRGAVYLGGAFGNVDHTYGRVTGITNGDTVNNFVDSGAARNIDTCNTMWDCDIKEVAPVLRFAGSGTANFFGDLDTFEEEILTTTTIIEGDTETTIDTTVTSTGGESEDFESIGHVRKITVYGAQIAQGAVTVLSAASGAGSGGVGGSFDDGATTLPAGL